VVAVGIGATAELAFDGSSRLIASHAELDALAGHGPDRCVHARAGRQVCRWQLAGQLFRRDQPAATGALNLVCDLPKNRAAGSGPCVALEAPADGALQAPAVLPQVSAAPPKIEHALAALTEASDMLALSQLAGDVPAVCRARMDFQECRWNLREGTSGHRLLASLVGKKGPIALDCLLPLDGGPRTEHSCRVVAAAPSPRD
jgi:hypothetical protein